MRGTVNIKWLMHTRAHTHTYRCFVLMKLLMLSWRLTTAIIVDLSEGRQRERNVPHLLKKSGISELPVLFVVLTMPDSWGTETCMFLLHSTLQPGSWCLKDMQRGQGTDSNQQKECFSRVCLGASALCKVSQTGCILIYFHNFLI